MRWFGTPTSGSPDPRRTGAGHSVKGRAVSDRREQIVPLTPLGGRNSGRGAALAVGGVLVAVAALVGAGILGRLSEQPRASAAPLASPPSAPTPGPDATAAAAGDAGDVV